MIRDPVRRIESGVFDLAWQWWWGGDMTTLRADASAEKRLFISLLTRDIPLVAAFLDLIDNSINSSIEPFSARLKTASDYVAVFDDESIVPSVPIAITIAKDRIKISDSAGGISSTVAADHVFKFGRGDDEHHESDRLSVYGIGLKRAIFKMGNRIKMCSDHVDGGFELDLTVSDWARDKTEPWTFDITERAAVTADKTGTTIEIFDLYSDVSRRIDDGVFESQLRDAVASTYAYYLAKFVTLSINEIFVDGNTIDINSNHTSETFPFDGVSCAITAGIGTPEAGGYRSKSSGWFVFCNGRTVISADKSLLTGWGSELPIFQPKHRPFLGTVFFVAENAELLPWTTTKSAINEDSAVWQQAKRKMASVGRAVITFLDGRYTDEGTELASKELQEASKTAPVSVLKAAAQPQSFVPPKAKAAPQTTRVQYDARVDEVKSIAKYLKRPSMSGSDIGRYTFNYFLRNEVGGE